MIDDRIFTWENTINEFFAVFFVLIGVIVTLMIKQQFCT